jgi:hypothetical protein
VLISYGKDIQVGKASVVELLEACYGAELMTYCESDEEIRFQVPAPIRDRQTAVFRSRAPLLNELAVSHRLSLSIGRGKYGVPEGFAFAIKSVETLVHSCDAVDGYHGWLRFEVTAKRKDAITALRSSLITKHGVEERVTITSFNILPPSLANFVRRGRQFLDFADVRMSRDTSYLSTIADNHFRYYPSEEDRLSDGKRVDHVPALVLIEIALSVSTFDHGVADANISAEFLNYTDPRLEFDILRKQDGRVMEFVQNGQLVAVVHISAILERNCPIAPR